MITQPPHVEEKALRYLEERNIKSGLILKVLREQFEMTSGQAQRVAERSVQSETAPYHRQRRGGAA